MQVHVDTDFGGDPDDACALAMLLGWPDVEIVGITTNLDAGGRRAGCVEHYLALAGRTDVRVVAGAGGTLGSVGEQWDSTWGDERFWPTPVVPRPASPGAALDLLRESVAAGATVLAIGAFTNLALLEVISPGALRAARIVASCGYLGPPSEGFPRWGPEMLDFNVHCDPLAAEIVFNAGCDLTLASPNVSIGAHLRRADLPRLRAAGPLGELLARQSMANAAMFDNAALARQHTALPEDLLNFHWDPVTCAVAVGWPHCTIARMRLAFRREPPYFERSEAGRSVDVLTALDGAAFAELWLQRVEAACTV